MRITFEISALEDSPSNSLRHYEIEFSEPVNADWLSFVIRQALDAYERAENARLRQRQLNGKGDR